MRRFVTLALILVFSIPVGLSISGCKKSNTFDFCNGGSSGEQEGQVTNIDLEPKLFGLSLPYGSVAQVGQASATDCKGDGIGVIRFTYGTTNNTFADISPSGSVCAGTWNRNTPGGVPDFTTCSPPPPNQQLPIPPAPAFTTPTAPTATAGATSTLNYAINPNGINGTVEISLAGGPVLTGSISNTTNAATFATAFNAISAFSGHGIVATTSGNIVTVTGPVGVTETLSFAGTTLAGYVPAAFVTASVGGATSNAVPVYVHPAITSMQLANQPACFSQGTTVPLVASVTANVGGVPTDITTLTGPLNFVPQDSSIVSINATLVPPLATAVLPGSTIISASTSNASAPSGVYFTCPPKSITLSVPNTTATSITVHQNTQQSLNATVVDTNGVTITGLSLEYISTSIDTVNANASGEIAAGFPGAGTITAICQPSQCNPSPLESQGVNGNGLSVTSNPIQVTTPGTVNTILYMASTNSQYFSNVDFSTGTIGAPSRLPFVPNSMFSDKFGQTIYFGSPSELFEVSMVTNSVTKEDASVKGTLVGVSNDGTVLVMSDAVHNLIYIYFTGTGSNTSFGGIAKHVAFSPDNQHIYISGTNASDGSNFWVFSEFDGWHSYTLPASPVDIAVSVPSISAFLAGTTATLPSGTSERSYCPALAATPPDFYPEVQTSTAITDKLGVTNDSNHLLGASVTGDTLTDFHLTLSTGTNNPGACPTFFNLTTPNTTPLGVTPATITGVVPQPQSAIAFVTYTNPGGPAGAKLPAYRPAAAGAGTISQVVLSNGATAPVSGIFSPDGNTFYAGTSGDNVVHQIVVPATGTPTDTGTIAPALPICTTQDALGNCTVQGSGFATPDMLADKPRATT